MRREKWSPTKYERICEKHFLPGDYHLPPALNDFGLGNRHLKKDAVPSVLNFPAHLKTLQKSPRPLPKRSYPEPSTSHPTAAKCSKVPSPSKSNIKLDHSYTSKISPHKLCAKYRERLKQKDNKLRNLRRKNIRVEKNVKGLILQLKGARPLNDELSNSLMENFGHMATQIVKNEAKNMSSTCGSRYGNEIKEFALTLHFYSPKAYKYVRKSLHLPHPATLRSWCVNIHCEPGFLEKSLNYIEEKVAEGQQDCVVLIDAMSIRKQIQWDRRTNTFVDRVIYGGIQAENLDSEATNALMLMASGLQKPWFVPIAYFLTHRVNGDILKQLIIEAINKLTEKGAEVHALVFDGASENLAMATKLGCNVKELDGSFDHPTKPGDKMQIILDICHMLKLARNAFADMKVFNTPSEEKISWQFVQALHKTQQKDVLHLGNKLNAKHIQWQNHKMKVSVAAQTLSHSVSAAITFLEKLKLHAFKGSKPTSQFIMLMNDLFDILNSKSKFGKHYKQPFTNDNILVIEGYIMNAIETLRSLKDENGVSFKRWSKKNVCHWVLHIFHFYSKNKQGFAMQSC